MITRNFQKIPTPVGSTKNCLTPKTPVEQIFFQSTKFLYFGPPYCIRHFEFLNLDLRFVINNPKKL